MRCHVRLHEQALGGIAAGLQSPESTPTPFNPNLSKVESPPPPQWPLDTCAHTHTHTCSLSPDFGAGTQVGDPCGRLGSSLPFGGPTSLWPMALLRSGGRRRTKSCRFRGACRRGAVPARPRPTTVLAPLPACGSCGVARDLVLRGDMWLARRIISTCPVAAGVLQVVKGIPIRSFSHRPAGIRRGL